MMAYPFERLVKIVKPMEATMATPSEKNPLIYKILVPRTRKYCLLESIESSPSENKCIVKPKKNLKQKLTNVGKFLKKGATAVGNGLVDLTVRMNIL